MQKIPLLLTRPEPSNAAFAEALRDRLGDRVQLIPCPLIRISRVPAQDGLGPDAVAIFTSANGVHFAPPSMGRRAYCVGAATTEAARAAGWAAEFAGQNAQELIATINAQKPAAPLRHLCGVHVRGEVAERLAQAGFDVARILSYDQVLQPLSAEATSVLNSQSPVIVPLFSPRAAAHFAASAPKNSAGVLVMLSQAVAQAAGKTGVFEVVIAAEPTLPAMLSRLEKSMESFRLG